jgi:hypothetical protein
MYGESTASTVEVFLVDRRKASLGDQLDVLMVT